MSRRLLHVRSLLFGTPLAVTAGRFDELASYLDARSDGRADALPLDALEPPPAPVISIDEQGIAVVPIRGTLTRRGGGMDALSGLTSYDDVIAAVEEAATTPGVRGLVLAFDSPGGAATGAPEAAAALRAVADGMPVYAVADGMAASAAYWLAMQADKLFVSSSAVVGSIGIFAVRDDASAAEAQAGRTRTIIKSGALKGAGDPRTPFTDAERADLQRQVDQLATLFFDDVATARKLTPDAIAKFEGRAFTGGEAVAVGLADRVGTVADAVAAMTTVLNRTARSRDVRALPQTSTHTTPPRAAAGGTMADTITTDADKPADKIIDFANDPRVKAHIDAEAERRVSAKLEQDREIRGLCTLFGLDAKVTEAHVASGKSRADLYAALQEAKVAAETAVPTRTAFGAAPDPQASTVKIDGAAIFARRAQEAQTARKAAVARHHGQLVA